MCLSSLPCGRMFRLVAASIACASSFALAEPPAPADPPPARDARPGGEGRPRPIVQVFEEYGELLRDLNLDADQAKQIREVMRSTRESMQAMARDAQTMSPQERLATFNEAIDKL